MQTLYEDVLKQNNHKKRFWTQPRKFKSGLNTDVIELLVFSLGVWWLQLCQKHKSLSATDTYCNIYSETNVCAFFYNTSLIREEKVKATDETRLEGY